MVGEDCEYVPLRVRECVRVFVQHKLKLNNLSDLQRFTGLTKKKIVITSTNVTIMPSDVIRTRNYLYL